MLRSVLLSGLPSVLFACTVFGYDDWPQWQGPNRDGVSLETGLLEAWDEKPKLLWEKQLGFPGRSSVVAADDIVCTMSWEFKSPAVVLNLVALNATDGTPLWTAKVGEAVGGFGTFFFAGPYSTPTIDEDRVYAIAHTGELVCKELRT